MPLPPLVPMYQLQCKCRGSLRRKPVDLLCLSHPTTQEGQKIRIEGNG